MFHRDSAIGCRLWRMCRTPTQSVTSSLPVLQVQGAAESETLDEAESRPLSHTKAFTSGQPHDSSPSLKVRPHFPLLTQLLPELRATATFR